MAVFSPEEREAIFLLAENLTGSHQKGTYRREVIVSNVARRMDELGIEGLEDYLTTIVGDPGEFSELIHALTIHTTSWFRERPHFTKLQKYLQENWSNPTKWDKEFKLWCAASSTGEEVYTFALILEQFAKLHPGFKYKIYGSDIDPVSVRKAQSGIYLKTALKEIENAFHSFLAMGSGKTAKFFAMSESIRSKCEFMVFDLKAAESKANREVLNNMDWVVCRNVLIYFEKSDVEKIIKGLVSRLNNQGCLCLGHSEALDVREFKLGSIGNSVYYKTDKNTVIHGEQVMKKRILVVDDSETVRQVLRKNFETAGFLVHAVGSAHEADQYLKENNVDLITLDLRMPQIDGATWLKEARKNGLRKPVVIISDAHPSEAFEVLGALEKGAQDYVEKGKLSGNQETWTIRFQELIKAHEERESSPKIKKNEGNQEAALHRVFYPDLILIGASTGGTEALTNLMRYFPSDCPPVMVVQHIAHSFSKPFAERLANTAGLQLGQCVVDEELKPGHIYVGIGDQHMGLKQVRGKYLLTLSDSPPLASHRPAVDYLYRSACLVSGKIFAVLLTGMGKDGARGMLELRQKGAYTCAQDEESCVVFGMPKEAIRLGGVDYIGNIREIRSVMEKALSKKGRAAS